MINKKINNNKQNILLNTLFKSKSFYGESINKTKKNIYPFIYGNRHGYSIINLKYTILFLKRSLKLLNFLIKKKKKILIIGNTIDIKFLLKKNLKKNKKNLFFFNKKWINGTLTNKNIYSNLNKKIDLILIIKSSNNDNFFFKELLKIKKPIIALNNTNQDIKYINYPIINNCKNIKSLFFFMYLIRKTF